MALGKDKFRKELVYRMGENLAGGGVNLFTLPWQFSRCAPDLYTMSGYVCKYHQGYNTPIILRGAAFRDEDNILDQILFSMFGFLLQCIYTFR